MNSSVPTNIEEQLAQLRDIRLPAEISWWPIAPGWWILAALFFLSIFIVIFLHYRRRHSLKYAALLELQRLSQDSNINSMPYLATQISILIRRMVLSLNSDLQFASAYGSKWQEFLSHNSRSIPDSFIRIISQAPYASKDQLEQIAEDENMTSSELINFTRTWIRGYA